MTLEEFIKHNKGMLKQINGGEEVLNYLEELKTLRVELEKNSKELEIYKKALGLACKHWSDLEEAVEECGIEIKYHIYSPLPRERKVEVYLMKAREQNDENL